MVSHDLLFFVHLRLNRIFGSAINEPLEGITVITVCDFFSTNTSRRKTNV